MLRQILISIDFFRAVSLTRKHGFVVYTSDLQSITSR